jgi:hypothetical protein
MSRAVRFRAPKLRSGATFAQATQAMRGGAVLTLEFFSGQPRWELAGREVAIETVALLLASREIVPGNDTLFEGALSQTWRIRS